MPRDTFLVPLASEHRHALGGDASDALRVVAGSGFCELSGAEASFGSSRGEGLRAWEEFYQKMYRPSRAGGRQVPDAEARWLRWAARRGDIHFATLHQQRVAGVLAHRLGDELHLEACGVLHGSQGLRERGALTAAVAQALACGTTAGLRWLVWRVPAPWAAAQSVHPLPLTLCLRAHSLAGARLVEQLQGAFATRDSSTPGLPAPDTVRVLQRA